jgi:hypothetical protein
MQILAFSSGHCFGIFVLFRANAAKLQDRVQRMEGDQLLPPHRGESTSVANDRRGTGTSLVDATNVNLEHLGTAGVGLDRLRRGERRDRRIRDNRVQAIEAHG